MRNAISASPVLSERAAMRREACVYREIGVSCRLGEYPDSSRERARRAMSSGRYRVNAGRARRLLHLSIHQTMSVLSLAEMSTRVNK